MITSNQAVEALRSANPAETERQLPEDTWSTSALLEHAERRMAMKTQDPKLTRLEPRRPQLLRGPLIAAAALAVVLVIVGLAAVLGGGTPEVTVPPVETTTTAPTTTQSPTTTTATPSTTTPPATTSTTSTTAAPAFTEAEALFIVEEAMAAYNAGDLETFLEWRELGNPPGTHTLAYELAAEARLTVDGCTSRGFQRWTSLGTPVTGHGFDCDVTYTDSVLTRAGIEMQMTYSWVIGDDAGSSNGGSNEDAGRIGEFYEAFHEWMQANHPEVAATIRYRSAWHVANAPAPENVPTVLEFIDEFVAQSDTYPLTEPIPPAFEGGLS